MRFMVCLWMGSGKRGELQKAAQYSEVDTGQLFRADGKVMMADRSNTIIV
jgi:hypothetical protein